MRAIFLNQKNSEQRVPAIHLPTCYGSSVIRKVLVSHFVSSYGRVCFVRFSKERLIVTLYIDVQKFAMNISRPWRKKSSRAKLANFGRTTAPFLMTHSIYSSSTISIHQYTNGATRCYCCAYALSEKRLQSAENAPVSRKIARTGTAARLLARKS